MYYKKSRIFATYHLRKVAMSAFCEKTYKTPDGYFYALNQTKYLITIAKVKQNIIYTKFLIKYYVLLTIKLFYYGYNREKTQVFSVKRKH